MPGLAGLVRRYTPLTDPHHMIHAFKVVGLVDGVRYQYRPFHNEDAVILNTLTGLHSTLDQPALDPTGNLLLFLEGEVFNLGELRSRSGSRPNATPCDTLLAMYMRCGADFIYSINGEFNIVIYHKAEKRLDIFSDHIASMPMYYMEQSNGLLFGSEKKFILSLLKTAPAIDPVGLLQIVAHRHNLDERTFLDGLKRLMPGAHLTYQRGRLRSTRRQVLAWTVAERTPRIRELRTEWGGHLKAATQLRVAGKERILISLSGGLDSRAIACALPRDLRPLSSRTRGVHGSLEVGIAAEISDRLGFDHVEENPLTVQNSHLIPKIAWRTECEIPFMNALSIANHRALKDCCHFVTGGWLGDVSSGAHIAADMLIPTSRQAFVERAYWRCLAPAAHLLPRIFSQEFLQKTLPDVREAFFESFMQIEGTTNIQVYEMWDLYQRQRRQTTSSMPVDSYLFEKIRPFYDKEYLNFTLTLPARLRFGQTLYQSMIWRLGPEIRSIPSSNNQLRLRSSLLGNLSNKGLTLAHRAFTRRVRKVRPRYRNSIEQRPVEDLGDAIRKDASFRVLVERYLSSDDFDSSVFNQNGVKKTLDEHYQGVSDYSYVLGHMATLAAGLPYFLNRTLRCPPEAEPLRPAALTKKATRRAVAEGVEPALAELR